IYEAMKSVHEGADELDMVINIGAAKSGKWDYIKREISDLITATPHAIHKLIIETAYLTDDEKIKASLAVMDAGAEFVKTSTGFAPGGASASDVLLIKSATKGKIGIKASGGIKTLHDMMVIIEAGATRIGTSSGVSIMKEFL
ncbi:MAG: deoxyribose-phosphate aldolase, partial [Nitrospirae bacterium]|nr:deoxyribose-phosphate aldolase [Nitrospirota bacterium]